MLKKDIQLVIWPYIPIKHTCAVRGCKWREGEKPKRGVCYRGKVYCLEHSKQL